MQSTSGTSVIPERHVFYFRQRYRNRIFQSVVAFFAEMAEKHGLTKRDVAIALGKDPAQITRWLSGPGNWTLDTVSDLLLAMNAELDHEIVRLDDKDEGENVLLFGAAGAAPTQKQSLVTRPALTR